MKKLNIRTVKQQKFEIEIDENETVAKLKQIIQDTQNIEASTQVLIFAGKFMEDPKQIREYSINEKDFVVLSVKAQANRPVSRPTNVTTTPPNTNNPPTSNTNVSSNPPTTNTTQTQSTSTANRGTGTSTNPPSTNPTNPEEELVMGSSYEEKVKEIVDMGFPREEVVRALKLSFNNTSRAVEYLTSGFPDLVDDDVPQQGTGTGQSGGNVTIPQGGSGISGGVPQGGNVFAMLRNHPLFIQMRALVQSNPQYLEQLLNNISENSPELFQIIQQNQDQFVQFLNEPVSQEQLQQALASTLGINPGSGTGTAGTGTGTGSTGTGTGTGTVPQNPRANPPQRQVQVQLTAPEVEAVNNLVNMGFERNRVLHYFLLFDKDQEMTANYLFDHPTEEGDQ